MTDEDRDAPGPDEGTAASRSSSSPRKKRKQLPLWQETILLLVIALGLALVIKTFFAQAFYIPSESMEPGLVTQDRILVQKVSYWSGEPERGDVVVFEDPGSWLGPAASQEPSNPIIKGMSKIGLYPTGGHLVKRVVGVAGDVITCCDDEGRILVNGEPVDEEEYVKDDPGAPCNGPMVRSCEWEAGPVPEGHVFVMGDNRGHSADSTFHMCTPDETDCVPGREYIPVDLVVGKVFVVLWPWDNFRIVRQPDAFSGVPDAS